MVKPESPISSDSLCSRLIVLPLSSDIWTLPFEDRRVVSIERPGYSISQTVGAETLPSANTFPTRAIGGSGSVQLLPPSLDTRTASLRVGRLALSIGGYGPLASGCNPK